MSELVCHQCGGELETRLEGGLCPKCLVRLAFDAGQGEEPTATPDSNHTQNENSTLPAERSDQDFVSLPGCEILKVIGRGGMGVVYQARQTHLDRLVAVKVLPDALTKLPGFSGRFLREARIMAQLNHPNIVTLHDSGSCEGRLYLILEYVEGSNLAEVLADRRLTTPEVMTIASGVCEALTYAHSRGVIHRDIKPSNILIDHEGRVKVMDLAWPRSWVSGNGINS